jgi:glycosyltransferase 2 family protein
MSSNPQSSTGDGLVQPSSLFANQRWRRFTGSALISLFAAIYAIRVSDWDSLRGLSTRISWRGLPWLAVLVLAIVILTAWRWRLLLDRRAQWSSCLRMAAIGLAGNQVLPFRGGDAVRAIQAAKLPGISLHRSIAAMAMEKVLDLMATAMFGIGAAGFLLSGGKSASTTAPLVGSLLLGMLAIFLWGARSGWLHRFVRSCAWIVRMNPRAYRHVLGPVLHLRNASTIDSLALPICLTGAMWFGIYEIAYVATGYLVGITITPSEAFVLQFAAALGMALPAAPSGIGTLHAAIVSAFLLLGRSPGDGLVVAVAFHAVFFIGLCGCGLSALWIRGTPPASPALPR